jgi:hypothetical protein
MKEADLRQIKRQMNEIASKADNETDKEDKS